MKKAFFALIPALVLLAGAMVLLRPAPAHASSFNRNDLMDDSVFNNSNSMSASQIDTWLNSNFGSTSCISTAHGFSAPDPIGYSPSHGFTYNGAVTAGQVIADAAQAYGLNPQVLIATLQKEEGIVRGDGPYGCGALALSASAGYACTDSGTASHTYTYTNGTDPGTLLTPLYYINGNPVNSVTNTCVNSNLSAGFSEQVVHAAWLLKFGEERSEGNIDWNIQKTNSPQSGDIWDNSDDPQTCYGGPMTQGTFKRCSSDTAPTFYDGSYTIDGTSVQILTGPTAALYWYTPHFSGNQSFVTIYSGWFGPTTGPDYAWQLDSFTFNSTMGLGQTQTVTLKATNIGRLPWYNQNAAPNTPMRIGTWSPGRASPFASGSWVNSTRPANMSENVVQPGQDGTFTFQLTAPGTPGTYVEGFNLLMENYQWLPWAGFSPTINVVRQYQWQVNSVTYSTGTGYMAPGTTQTITLKALNTGTATWTNTGGTPIRLGTWDPGRQSAVGSGWLSSIRAANMTEASVPPGQVGTFTFDVYMPDSSQHYERMNLVAEGTSWFNDAGLTLYLQGQTFAWQPLWVSPSTSNWTMPRGTKFFITLQVRNTGTATWYKNGNFPIRLGTDNPFNRGSALYVSSWLDPVRPAALLQDSVPPGSEGTFTFNAQAPTVAGSRPEAFNLVAEGILWFNDPGFSFNITST